MTEQYVLDLGGKTIWIAIQLAAPALLATLVMGVLISIFQAATQINEQTLAFIPKIIAMTVALMVCGPWLLTVLMGFTSDLFQNIPSLIH